MKDAGRGRREGLRREPSLPVEVPRLRADPAHLGCDRRAHAEAARDGRQGRRRDADARADRRAQSIHREASPPQSPPVTASKRNVRVMYASQTSVAPPTFVLFTNVAGQAAFFVRTVSRESAARGVRFFRQPDPHPDARPCRFARPRRRKTAAERAPDRRKPVKKGPGSKLEARTLKRRASRTGRMGQARRTERGRRRGKRGSQSNGSKQGAAPQLSKRGA